MSARWTRYRHEGARPSTRAKDLVDLALIAELSRLDASRLRDAIEATFARRGTHPVPTGLPQPPAGWETQFRQLAETVGIPGDLAAGHAAAAAVIEPITKGEVSSGVWGPERQRWIAE